MAYREFHQEKYFDAPDIQVLPHTLQALNTLAHVRAQRQAQAQNLQANYKIGVENGYFPQLQNQLNKGAQHLVGELNRHFAEGGQYIPPQIKNGQAYLSSLAESGKTLMNQFKSLQEEINLKKNDDKYYNATADEEKLKQAFSQNLDTPEKIKQHLDSVRVGKNSQDYDRGQVIADFVNGFGKKSTDQETVSESGLKTKSFKSNQFLNDKGVPEVTTEHVNGLLNKHPIMYQAYAEDATKQIAEEIKAAKANNEEWTRGKTDEQLFSDVAHGPNPLGKRIDEMAKRDLAQYEDTQNNFSIDAGNYQAGSRYGITSKGYNPPADGFKQGDLSGPSRMLVKKTGVGDNRFLYIPSSQAEWRYDNDTKEYVKTGVNSSIPFVMTSYQWGPVDAQGKPVVLSGKSTDDMVKQINEMPISYFGRDGIVGSAPIVSGRAIDKASVLNLAYNGGKLKKLEDEVRSNPDDQTLKNDLSGLHEALDNIQADRSFDSQLIQKYIGADVIKNQSFATSKDDPNVQAIQGDTGMNVYDPKSLNADMKRVKEAIDKRVKEAQRAKVRVKTETVTKTSPKGVAEEMITVISPEGTSGRIPKSKLEDALKAGFKQK